AVYLAAEAALEREVAIKVLPPDRSATQDSRDRFRREARTAAKLSHPNIVPLHTFGDVDGTLYFVMGYVRGESLATRLKREGRIPVEEARRILIELCDALDYAHKLGIVHRDIKPDNVLIEEETGRAMLLDFGVAKAVGAGQTMTEVGSVLGTPQYMSPEQAQGKSDIDARSDLYSLGVMGYAMFAGRLPFEGATPGEVMAQHITREAPALKMHAPDVPPEIASALTRCLEKDRDRRWPDANSIKGSISLPSGDETPPALDGLGVFLIAPLACGLLLLYIGAWWLGGGDVAPPFPVVPLIAFSSALTPLLLMPWRWHHLRQLGFEPRTIVEAILAPLQYWPGWLPDRLRRRGDVWDRLPRELRAFRSAMGLYFVSVVTLLLPSIAFRWGLSSSILRTGHAPFDLGPKAFDALVVIVGILPALAGMALGARWEVVRRRKGIDPYVSNRMINTPTSRPSFWAKPEVTAHLLPSNAAPARTTPSSARDLGAAIANAASNLTGAARTAAGRAREAAARVEADLLSI
ncbi:MAG TPA: serine/threonine-protein kinase, partial [Vicinamibacteria bacterium]|nr:serine/threonine-protein kinase [Vicinamibacteria bacterium]